MCRYGECHFVECHYDECRYAECRGTFSPILKGCSFLAGSKQECFESSGVKLTLPIYPLTRSVIRTRFYFGISISLVNKELFYWAVLFLWRYLLKVIIEPGNPY